MHGTRIIDVPTEDWEFALGVNVWGIIHGIRHFVPAILKHGALGPAGGGIRLSWAHDRSANGAALAIRWEESSPAIVGPPQRTGFGNVVVTRITERKLGAEVGLEFRPGLLTWTAVLPRRHFSTAP